MTSIEARPLGADIVSTPDWYRSATRWTQLTLTDDDPAHLDVDFWIDVMRDSRSNALCLSAGGYMAFYPTRIPYHHRSAHLGDTDPFGALVQAARSLGMYVMARVDPHAIHQDAADAHPEWLARDQHGQPIAHESMPGLWWTDPFSVYHREFTTEVALEIVRNYDVDAIFANRWEGYKGISYSTATTTRFQADTGLEFPRPLVVDDPVWPTFVQWRSQQLSELVVLWDDAVRAVKPHVRFIPNRGAALTRDLVHELVDDRYPMFFVDKQGRSGIEPAWTAGRIGKRARGMYPERPVVLITSVGPEHAEYRWKDSVADVHETRSLIVDGFAQGALPWFTKFKAECFDTRWVAPIVDAFHLHEKCEPVLGRLRHTAEIAVLDTQPAKKTPWSAGADSDHEDGVYQALVEARLPFEYIAEEALAADRLDGVRVLILPACPDLDPAQIDVLREFVAGGGSIVAAYDSTLTTGADGQRQFALGDILGVKLVEDVRGPVKNKYATLHGPHPITTGFEGAQRIVAGTYVLDVAAVADADVPLRFVPDYPDLPMEEVYPRPGRVTPAVVTRQHASGARTAYIAFNIGEIYWQALQSDHGRLLANAVRWALGEPPQVHVAGRGLVDIAVQEGPGELAVSVVNLSNPMAMRGQAHELVPLYDQRIEVRLPTTAKDVSAQLLVADRPHPVEITGSTAQIHLDRIDLIEVVHLQWAAR